MIRFIIWIVIFSFCSSLAQGQGQIKGTLLDGETRAPLPFATVFLANTTLGAVTDTEGAFSITNIPTGEYEIIVSFMGYYPLQQQVVVEEGKSLQIEIVMTPQIIDLKESLVEDIRDKSWYKNLKIFEEYFLGTSMNARRSKILNPKVLIMDDQQKPGYLIVSAREPILIENINLGYQIRFVLESFECNPEERRWSYYGYPYFEELEVPARRLNRVSKNRDRAYFGSLTHFLQAVYQDKLEAEGFEVYLVNPVRDEDQLYEELLSDVQVSATEMMLRNEDGNAYFHYRKPIFIQYNHESEETAFSMRFNKRKKPYQISKFILRVHRIRMEQDGRYFPATGIYTEGYMGWERVADLMPFGYVPQRETTLQIKSPEN